METESYPLADTLRPMGFFAEFNRAEIEALLGLAEEVRAAKGSAIVRQDDPGECMFLLVAGRARVLHRRGERAFELASLGPGDFFGELALVDEGPRSADVVAEEDCRLLRVDQAVVGALAGVYPGAAFKLMVAVGRALVRRLRSGNRRYIDSLVLLASERD